MLIRSMFDIQFYLPNPAVVVALLHLHPSVAQQLRSADELLVEHLGMSNIADQEPRLVISQRDYIDSFGNICSRFVAPTGHLRLSGRNLIESEDQPEKSYPDAKQASIDELPHEVLQFLLPSRYCEVDLFGSIAQELFGAIPEGWTRATAIRDWVHEKVIFNYNTARPTKTAMDVFIERVGVCRDFQHLAIALSRCQNIPARYVTGYIGDIRRPSSGVGDFSAWYQVFLDGQWISLDARHNYPRLGRILMATGRDAADVAITTSFGVTNLTYFYADSWEVDAGGNRIPLPEGGTAVAVPIVPTQTNASRATPIQTQAATA